MVLVLVSLAIMMMLVDNVLNASKDVKIVPDHKKMNVLNVMTMN